MIKARFEIYRDSAGEWRWRLRAVRGGKIIADSGEGYSAKAGAHRAVRRLKDILRQQMTATVEIDS